MIATVQKVNTRDPLTLCADAEAAALATRDVYTQRAIDALSSPWPGLVSLLGHDNVGCAFDELTKQARQMEACCSESHPVPVIARYDEAGQATYCTDTKLAPHHCGRPLCTRCERRPETHAKSAMRLGAALSGAMLRGSTPRFVTLTVKNQPRLGDVLGHLNRSSLKLRQSPEWAKHVEGGTRALEVTHNDGAKRRLRRNVARQHGILKSGDQYVEETKTRKESDGRWVTTTHRRTIDDRDAKAYLDALHDAGADIYAQTPWERLRCHAHGTHGCDECDPRGWHPHHHMICEGDFWLALCESCTTHGRHNCPACRSQNAERRKALAAGTDNPPEAANFEKCCGGWKTAPELARLRGRGARRMDGETETAYTKRLRTHNQAHKWLSTVTYGSCRRKLLQRQIANEHRLGALKGWPKRRTQKIDRLQRKLASVPRWEDAAAARCLSCAWSDATGGDSDVVDVRSIKGWREALKATDARQLDEAINGVKEELLKYLTKGAVMPASAMVEFAWTMRRRRRVAWFGDWQGLEVDTPEPTELRCGTTFGVLWETWRVANGTERLYFKGPERLCGAVALAVPDTELWRSPLLPPTWFAGSMPLSSPLAEKLYRRAAALIPARAPPTHESADGLPPPAPTYAQDALPF